jgi:hypothetical protein
VWKGDTSSDEIDGHMTIYPLVYDIFSDENIKQRALTIHLGQSNATVSEHICKHKFVCLFVWFVCLFVCSFIYLFVVQSYVCSSIVMFVVESFVVLLKHELIL